MNETRKLGRQAGWGLPGWKIGSNSHPQTRAGGTECASLEQPAGEVGFGDTPTQEEHIPTIGLTCRDLP